VAIRKLHLRHVESGRRVPVEVPTVFGRSDHYYRYTEKDARAERLRGDVMDGLAALNYIQISDDDKVSRTHGLLDPRVPALCDLNSTNGTLLNGKALPERSGEAGPLVSLISGDQVRVGRQEFFVEVDSLSEVQLAASVHAERHGVLAGLAADAPILEGFDSLLAARRGFRLLAAADWAAVIEGLYGLRARANAEGLSVFVLSAGVQAEQLLLGEEGLPFPTLLTLLQAVPGRKVMCLVAEGDPSSFERAFVSRGYEDMLLLTGPRGALTEEGIECTLGALDLRQEELRTGRIEAAPDSLLRALDRLIPATSNILNASWVGELGEALKVVFGARTHGDEQLLSHSLRLGSSTFRF